MEAVESWLQNLRLNWVLGFLLPESSILTTGFVPLGPVSIRIAQSPMMPPAM